MTPLRISTDPLGCVYEVGDDHYHVNVIERSPLGATRVVGAAYLQSKIPTRYGATTPRSHLGYHASMQSAAEHVIAHAQADRATEDDWERYLDGGFIGENARADFDGVLFLMARDLRVDPALIDLDEAWDLLITESIDDVWGSVYRPNFSFESVQSMILDEWSSLRVALE